MVTEEALENARILLVILKVLSIVPRLDDHCRSRSIENPASIMGSATWLNQPPEK